MPPPHTRVTTTRGPAVAISPYGTETDRERTRAAGFDVHLAKPVDPQAVETLLAS